MPTSYKMRRKVQHLPQQHAITPAVSASTTSVFSLLLAFIFVGAHAAPKLDTQLKPLINDDELLTQPENYEQVDATGTLRNQAAIANEPDAEPFNLYRSELKRLNYEAIHRILRDENEPNFRREDARYNEKRSNKPDHEVVRRAAPKLELFTDAMTPTSTVTSEKPAQHTFTLTNAQLLSYDAAHDYPGDHSAIYELDLSNNNLELLDLSAFTALRHAELTNNALTTIPLSVTVSHNAPSTIQILNLNNNQIAHAANVSSASLRELYLSGNQITQLAHLNLSMLSALETLDLSCNRIAELETAFFPQRMHNLKYLNLAYNRIGTIYRETFYNLLSLNTLLLSHNNISDIDYETFLALPNLQYLDLSYNQLRGEAIRALQGIPDLVRLSIAYNPEVGAAMQEFVASWSLKELDASGTGLCQIPAALAQSVRTLKLTDNWLKIINCGDLDSYPLLQYLDLSHSRIEDIEDDALGRLEILETLFLDHNQLRKVPLSLPTSLEHLFLQNNEIMDIHEQSFQGLSNLQTLDLSGNKLLYLPALPLPKLLTLNLRAAGLRGVSQAMVHTLPRLRDLLLDENPIKCSDLLSIAEWASPCRIVEQRSSSETNNTATTDLESLNIEGNSIMSVMGVEGEQVGQRQKEQQSNDNRIGFGQQEIEQIIAMSGAASDKLGQQHAQVQQPANGLMLGLKQDVYTEHLALDTKAATTNNQFKQKFVRMHNFFEKFKSNCGARKQTTDKRRLAEDAPPACAIELEGSNEETKSEMYHETSGASFHLPMEKMGKQNSKSNSKEPKILASRQQQNIDTAMKDIGTEEGNKKREMRNMSAAEAKLLKFNQKNFTLEIAKSSAPAMGETTAKKLTDKATTKTKVSGANTSSTDYTNYRTKAAFDYSAHTSEALATKAIIGTAKTTTKAIQQIERTYQATKSQLKNKTTAAPPTLLQVGKTVAGTGTGQSTAVNLWQQDSTAAKTTTQAIANRYSKVVKSQEAEEQRAIINTLGADDMQADAPKSMLESAEGAETVDNKREELQKAQEQKKIEGKRNFGTSAGTNLTKSNKTPESMLVKVAKTGSADMKEQQQLREQQQHDIETTAATKTTTNDYMQTEAPKSMQAKGVSIQHEASKNLQPMQQMRGKQLEQEHAQEYGLENKTTTKAVISDEAPKSMLLKMKQAEGVTGVNGTKLQEQKEKVTEHEEKHVSDGKASTTTVNAPAEAPRNMEAKALSFSSQQEQTQNFETNAKLHATPSLNEAKEMFTNQQQQQQQQLEGNNTIAKTTMADVEKILETGNGNKAGASAKLAADSAATMAKTTTATNREKSTTKTTTTTTDAQLNNQKLAMPANFLQLSRAQIATMGLEELSDNTETTTTTRILHATELPPQTAIPNLALEAKQPNKDNILTQSDSANDYDGYKVQQNVTVEPTKTTQFWQQHNFKRANSYPNDDSSGQSQQSEASAGREERKDALEAEYTEELITLKTTTHQPPAHKHEPLHLHVRDRHLIGTPLLQHRGENMLVEAVELLGQQTTTTTTTTRTTTMQNIQNATTTTPQTLGATTNQPVPEIAMNNKTLAKIQPKETGHQTKAHEEQESEVNAQTEITINSNGKERNNNNNNNAPNTKHTQAEAINVETNATPMQRRIGSDALDKQMLAQSVVTQMATTKQTKQENVTAKTAMDNINSEEHKATTTTANDAPKRRTHTKKHEEIAGGGGGGRSKPSLIMRKMTAQTKHVIPEHQPQPKATHYTLNTPRENEAVLRQHAAAMAGGDAYASGGKIFMNENSNALDWDTAEADISEHAEVAPPHTTQQHKHSTVNTPILRRSHERLLAAMHNARLDDDKRYALEQEHDTHQSFSAISNQQRERAHVQEREPHAQHGITTTHTQTQKLFDVRKVGTSSAHPALVILISCSLFFVLLIGLMHVYRCDILPWRRTQQRRPHHQLHFNAGAGDDDAHSFLHYHNNGGGQQVEARQQQQWLQQPPPRWHHSARERAPYSSPLHNLHVRELQKTSAVELEAATRVTRHNYDICAYTKNGGGAAAATKAQRNGSTTSNGSGGVGGEVSYNSSSSLSSTRSSSTAGIMDVDDGAFYVEMVSECGGVTSETLHSDMLPMELLAVTSASKRSAEEKDTLYAVTMQETASIRLSGVEASACSNNNNNETRVGKRGNALLSDSRKSKKIGSGTALTPSSASSSARKFDLW